MQFGKPIGAFQLTQKKLADMALELEQGHPARVPPRPDEGARAGCVPST